MINIADQLFQAAESAAANAAGGGDDSIPQNWEMRSKAGEYYFVDDKGQRFGGTYRSPKDANAAMAQAKKEGRFQFDRGQGVDRMSVRQPGQAPAPGTPAQGKQTGWRDRGAAKSGPFYVDSKGTEYYMTGKKGPNGSYNIESKTKEGKIEDEGDFWGAEAEAKNENEAMVAFFKGRIANKGKLVTSFSDYAEADKLSPRFDEMLLNPFGYAQKTRGDLQDRQKLDSYRRFLKKYPDDEDAQKRYPPLISKLENKLGIGSDRQPLGPSGQGAYSGPMTGNIGQGPQVEIPYTDPGTAFYYGGDQSNMGMLDPAQAVQQAGGAAAMPSSTAAQTGSAVFGGSVATPTAGEAPGQQAPRRGRSSWEAPGEAVQFTQEDFYPNPQDPFAGQYSTGVEYVARQGRMPMGALSKAAAALQDRQLQLDQKRQAFNDELYKPIKTATPYQQNFNVIVNREKDNFVSMIADAYTGGDVNKAYREIFASPQLRNKWRQLNADLEALGQYGMDAVAQAEKHLADAKDNKIASTSESRALARDILLGAGGYATPNQIGGSFETLVKNIPRFQNMMGRDRYFKENIVPAVKDFPQIADIGIDTATGQPLMKYENGRYIFFTEGSKKFFDTQKQQYAKEMESLGFGEGNTIEERTADNYKFLDRMLPSQVQTKTQVIDTWKGAGGSGDGGGDESTYRTAYQKINPQNPEYKDTRDALEKAGFVLPNALSEAEKNKLKELNELKGKKSLTTAQQSELDALEKKKLSTTTTTLDSVSFQEVTGGKPGIPRAISIGTTTIIPLEVSRDFKGRLFLVGKKATATNRLFRDERDNKQKPFTSLSILQQQNLMESGELDEASFPTVAYPLDRYEDVVVSKFGITGQQINDIIESKNPRKKGSQTQPAGARTSSLAAAQPDQAAMAKEWEAMKKANPNMSADAITAAVKKKFGVK